MADMSTVLIPEVFVNFHCQSGNLIFADFHKSQEKKNDNLIHVLDGK